MTVYLGKNPVGVGRIVEKKVAKTKFGATVDLFLGDVDADGNYVAPTGLFEVNLSGLKSVGDSVFFYKFHSNNNISKFVANDIIEIKKNAFCFTFYHAANLQVVEFNSVIEISVDTAFKYAFSGAKNASVRFNKLKKISGAETFSYAFDGKNIVVDDVFPVLEELSGNSVFSAFETYKSDTIVTFSKVKKITGGTATYYSTFGALYYKNTVWNFPSATEFTGYIWNVGSSYAGEIHFAAANQAAIEACDGYANKWGFQNATIFFDL